MQREKRSGLLDGELPSVSIMRKKMKQSSRDTHKYAAYPFGIIGRQWQEA